MFCQLLVAVPAMMALGKPAPNDMHSITPFPCDGTSKAMPCRMAVVCIRMSAAPPATRPVTPLGVAVWAKRRFCVKRNTAMGPVWVKP